MEAINSNTTESGYNRAEELKAFDETKAGVKGLVESGILKVPTIFVRPPNELNQLKADSNVSYFRVPIIDLQGEHQKVIDEIRHASENHENLTALHCRVYSPHSTLL
ncbi:hypothetical protein IFM89_014141 [Coptis chinensis]|uniref:Uncharacterized protein n=1 Tax=Coptis chinensis TaxID=261450 RepID=A0A835HUB4_9MAGN|nr:hypothetical protein IFM89_010360 [Coptis chinensis]KAF9605150.1 hypothetical protein IFM89_014141 [Coptis chinensis]